MSNPVRYDPLLVRYLADELSERLRGRRIRAVRLDPDARLAALDLEDEALVLSLHPTRGHTFLGATPAAADVVALPRRATLARVGAPADERILTLDVFGTPADRPRRIVVELMTNQWNVLVLDGHGRILSALWRREAGGRALRPGAVYTPPPPAGRAGAQTPVTRGAWRALLGPLAPDERRAALLRSVAYTSPINAGAILGRAAREEGDAALDAAYDRYAALAGLPPARPCSLQLPAGAQPYPLPLPDVSCAVADTLLDAFRAAAESAGAVPAGAVGVPPELVERLRRRVSRTEARIERLWQELEGAAAEAERLRRGGDLLLAHLGVVRKGMESVELPDFEGGAQVVALDPALSPVENANAFYDQARRRERASERVPPLIEKLEGEVARLGAVLARAEAGEAQAAEVEAAAGEPDRAARAAADEEPLPFRRYRTSRGLEVRVGRSGRANDDLTFHHSAPNDVWLHARDVAGAHVILRWGDAEANPSQRDLSEAAVLAALHSRARTSSVVAVDWTRRKYVRKPRKAPPGAVVPDRVKTVFVEPDAALERRMREAAET